MQEHVPFSYTQSVGDRLRSLRRERRLSLMAVEESTGREFKASVLGAYERGERVISILRLQRLAQFYRVPVDRILPSGPPAGPSRDGSSPDGPTPFTPKRPVTIDLSRLAETESVEGQVVRRYVNGIQSQRTGFSGATIAIRVDDLRCLGRFLDRDETAMEMRLVELGLRC